MLRPPTTSSHNNIDPWRIKVFGIIGGFILLVFIGQLFRLQILQGDDFIEEALINRLEELNIPTARGSIYDRNGIVLAQNIPSYNIVIIPANLPDDEGEIQQIFRELSALSGVPVNLGEINTETPFNACISEHGIAQIVNYGETTSPFRPVEIRCDVPESLALIIQERAIDWPGVEIQIESLRDYPTGRLTAAVIGYLGPVPASLEEYYNDLGFVSQRDKVGYAGIELAFQDELGGQNGLREVEVDVAGQILRDVRPPDEPTPGYNVQLTIDTRLQEAATAIVESELEGWNNFLNRILSNNAVAIAMNPQTGEILALVTIPTYENNRFARFIPTYYYEQLAADLTRPLFNHAISAEHPPGSVFKLTTAVGALNEGVVTADQIIEAPPEIIVPETFTLYNTGQTRRFVDWNDAGFGQLDFIGGLANSSNVYFYKLGGGFENEVPNGLGICRLKAYSEAMGYGSVSGIELPGEEDGLIPDPKWKRINQGENWSTGNTYNASVGQGLILATPLQVLMSGAVIAADGRLMQPTIVREVVDDQGNVIQPFQPNLIHDLTVNPVVQEYQQYTSGAGQCQPTGNFKSVDPSVIELVQQGMRAAVTRGTLEDTFETFTSVPAAGKTGTAEYCDNFAQAQNRCVPGQWPTHAWTIGYAPYENPEIVVVAFVYNGGEGASVAGPIVRQILEAYFELKRVDATAGLP